MSTKNHSIKDAFQPAKLRTIFPYLAFVLVFLVFSLAAGDRFLTVGNMKTILQQSAVMAIVSFGMLFVIVQGNIDLSVGGIIGMSGIIAADIGRTNIVVGCIAGVLVGLVVGLINGLLYNYLKVPTMIITLGVQKVLRGLTIIYSHSNSIPFDRQVKAVGKYPIILFILAVVFVICFVLMRYTVFGRYCIAVGGDKRVSELNGIPARTVSICGFIVSGILAAIGGIVLGCRLGAAVPTNGTGFELECVASVALGGASLAGGVGSIVNTMIGALIITMLGNGLVILGVGSEMQEVCTGIVMIIAVFISLDRERAGTIK